MAMTMTTMAVTMTVFLLMAVTMTIHLIVTFLFGCIRSSMAVPMTHVSKQQHSNLEFDQTFRL